MMQELARYWGTRLRLGQVRGETECPAELHHRDRRTGYSFHPRPLPAPGRAAADRHTRMARIDHRAAEDHRAAHQSHGAWCERRGRVSPSDSLSAGLRVLRQADHHRVGSGPHRARLGRADETPRIHPVRGARRRPGRGRHAGYGYPGRTGAARHSLQHAWHRSSRHQHGGRARQPAATGSVRRGENRVRSAQQLLCQARGLRPDHDDPPADAVRTGGTTHRPGRVHAGPRDGTGQPGLVENDPAGHAGTAP